MPARRSHYIPSPVSGINHRRTPRADRILSLLDSYRLLRTTHIIECLKYFNESTSAQRTVKYLRWLMDERAVLRIRHDPDSRTVASGSLPKIYGRYDRANLALNERRDRASRVVPHTLAIADTMIFGVVRACRESMGSMQFRDAPEIVTRMGSDQVKTSAKPFTWPVDVTYREKTAKCSLTPDRLFGTVTSEHTWFYVLEEDKSTEPHQRNDFSFDAGTSLFRKLLCYVFAYHAQVPLQRYGIRGLRILFVTDSQKRIERVRSVWQQANEVLKEFQRASHLGVRPVPHNVLLCIDRPTLRAGNIFTVPWVNGRGERVTLDLPAAVAP
jgi:hypothetical protein